VRDGLVDHLAEILGLGMGQVNEGQQVGRRLSAMVIFYGLLRTLEQIKRSEKLDVAAFACCHGRGLTHVLQDHEFGSTFTAGVVWQKSNEHAR
jgi:hypothetical protein